MAEKSCFMNSVNGDRKYAAKEFAEFFSTLVGNGIFNGGLNLKAMAFGGNMDVKVLEGKAWINGYYYNNYDAPLQFTLNPAHETYARIDRVVVRLDLNANVRAVNTRIKEGTPSSNPIAPTLTRDNAIWEIALADVRVNPKATAITDSNITDLRLNRELCGTVEALVKQADFTEIFNQYMAKWNETSALMDAHETEYQVWFEGFKALGQQAIADFQTLYAGKINEFNAWFDDAKAHTFALVNNDFHDYSSKVGYKITRSINESGIKTEQIVNVTTNSILATRITEKLSNGDYREVERWLDTGKSFEVLTNGSTKEETIREVV